MTATTPRRVYEIHHVPTGATRLIRATNVAQAIRHAARTAYTCEVASQDVLIKMLQAGVQVEDAGAEQVDGDAPC